MEPRLPSIPHKERVPMEIQASLTCILVLEIMADISMVTDELALYGDGGLRFKPSFLYGKCHRPIKHGAQYHSDYGRLLFGFPCGKVLVQ